MLAFISLLLAYSASGVLGQSPQVTISGTTFTGISRGFGPISIDFFGGIPFAEPPVGDLRFAPPVFMDTYNSTSMDATDYGSICAQPLVVAPSEDCLTLNIFRQTGVTSSANLPVLVWIYGGGFGLGDSTGINASHFIAQSVSRDTPIMFVSINYRVGPFGFPQGAEAGQRGALNLGLKDQLVALQWVQRHIAAFGGNPSEVTLGGESSGAMSIAFHYFNSDLENLVRGAILESGSPGSLPWFPPERRQDAWDSWVALVPACTNATQGDTFACMRTATTNQLILDWGLSVWASQVLLAFVPVLDGPSGIMPDLPSRLSAQGTFAHIPFIAGANLDEGTSFILNRSSITSEDDIMGLMTEQLQPYGQPSPQFTAAVDRMFELYPDDPALGSPYGTGDNLFNLSSQYKRASAIAGDVLFQGPRRRWMEVASAAGVPAWGYLFTDQSAANASDPASGVTHATEVPYVFGYKQLDPDPSVRLLSTAMLDYWLSFVTSGTPNDMNGTPRTEWVQYTPDSQVLIQFDRSNFTPGPDQANFSIIPDTYREEQIAFINSIEADLNELEPKANGLYGIVLQVGMSLASALNVFL